MKETNILQQLLIIEKNQKILAKNSRLNFIIALSAFCVSFFLLGGLIVVIL